MKGSELARGRPMDHASRALRRSLRPIRRSSFKRLSMPHFPRLKLALGLLVLGYATLFTGALSSQENGQTPVVVADVTGAIGVATTMHIKGAIEEARAQNA